MKKQFPETQFSPMKKHTLNVFGLKYPDFYPALTPKSVNKAVNAIKKTHRRIDSITLDYYLRPKKYSGRGYGKLKKQYKKSLKKVI